MDEMDLDVVLQRDRISLSITTTIIIIITTTIIIIIANRFF